MTCYLCRDEALKVVLEFAATAGLAQVARLVYQLEVLLLHPTPSNGKVSVSFGVHGLRSQHAMHMSMPHLQQTHSIHVVHKMQMLLAGCFC